MRLNHRLPQRTDPANDADPREQQGAEIIDLATRTVIPAVARKKGPSDALGLAAGVAIVALLGAVTLWSLDGARSAQQGKAQPQSAAQPAAPVTAPARYCPGSP